MQDLKINNKENTAEIMETPSCVASRTQSTFNTFQVGGNCELDEPHNNHYQQNIIKQGAC